MSLPYSKGLGLCIAVNSIAVCVVSLEPITDIRPGHQIRSSNETSFIDTIHRSGEQRPEHGRSVSALHSVCLDGILGNLLYYSIIIWPMLCVSKRQGMETRGGLRCIHLASADKSYLVDCCSLQPTKAGSSPPQSHIDRDPGNGLRGQVCRGCQLLLLSHGHY